MIDEAHDIRFAGTDPRLLRVAAALGLDVAGLDTRSLPEAVAAEGEAKGFPDSDDARSLFADLLRSDADAHAKKARKTRPETKVKKRKRERLAMLVRELHAWRETEQRNDQAAHVVPRYLALDGEGNPIAGATLCDGVEPMARRMAHALKADGDTLEKWLYQNHEAVALVALFRPVKVANTD